MKDKVHVSARASMPKGSSKSGRTLDHCSVGGAVPSTTAPNNPNATASGRPGNFEGGPGRLQKKVATMNYAENPKKG